MAVALLVLTAAVLGGPLLAGDSSGGSGEDGAVVTADKGRVRGVVHPRYREFLGIPFAAPPVGKLRWRAPQPHGPWPGVREATRPSSRCAQGASVTGTPASHTEDCLSLNVTTPDSATTDHLKPVMVWLHGGGFVEGSGSEYDPHRLAVQGDVVVVTVNYRLGIFGNLGLPGLEDSGAFALQDQQAALRWVQRNARAFGGDPDNVTLFGQSAGGQSVCAQLASPTAAGLFHRAIIQSAFCTRDIPANLLAPGLPTTSPWEDLKSLAARGKDIAVELGCPDPATAITCLRHLPPSKLMPVFGQFAGLSYGTTTLPENPYQVLRDGRMHDMPVLSGTTRDETTFFQALHDLAGKPLTARRYHQYLADAFGIHADQVAARYPLSDYESPSHAWTAVTTDSGLTCPTMDRSRRYAQHVPTYTYEFADQQAPPTLPDVSYPYGAYHSADALYLFDIRGDTHVELTNIQRRLAHTMIAYWTNFARTGNPNSKNLPNWSRHTPNTTAPYAQSLATGKGSIKPVDLTAEHKCKFWAKIEK